MMLSYSELIQIPTFEERLEYLSIDGKPAELTFSELRYLNQKFYNSRVWKTARLSVIGRDMGFDLGVPGHEIFGRLIVHHMNPLLPKDIYNQTPKAVDPEFLITVSHNTHEVIHFGSIQPLVVSDRHIGDTRLW